MNIKEKQVIVYYLKNIISNDVFSDDIDIFYHNLGRYSKELFGFDFRDIDDIIKSAKFSRSEFLRNVIFSKADWITYIKDKAMFEEMLTKNQLCKKQYDADITSIDFDKNTSVICDALNVPDFCRPLLRCLIYIQKIVPLRKILESITGPISNDLTSGENVDLFCILSNAPIEDIQHAIAENSPLFESGILTHRYGDIVFTPMFSRLINMKFNTPTDVRNTLVGAPLQSELTKKNFDYIANDFTYLSQVLGQATRNNLSGINILLYGNPGCGKTELATVACQQANLKLYATSVSLNAKDNRLSNVAQMQTILRNEEDAVILFDEAEDIFSLDPFLRDTPSKLYINRNLERNARPVIWITNNVSKIDPAYLRRFNLALSISDPDECAKKIAWMRIFEKYDYKITDSMLKQLVQKYRVPMAIVDTAIKNAKMLNDDKMIVYTIDNFIHASDNNNYINTAISNRFDVGLVNTDTDLDSLTQKIKDKGILNFSLCLYGASGTGKTEYAKYLGDILGMPVIQKRASDIKGRYVGETEKNIANAFYEAQTKKAILVFDEADSFLTDRTHAQHQWEASCVNEMLTQMESAKYPFVCTTNLMDNIDKAALRRFSFKIKYDFLKPNQVISAFKVFFKQDVSKEEIIDLVNLAPGDFVVVKNQADLLDITDKSELLSRLRQEQQVKNCREHKVKIGFHF